MGKTRSSRRMRKYKSITKRGGRWFGSLLGPNLLEELKDAIKGDGNTRPSYQEFKRQVKSDRAFVVSPILKEQMEEGIKNALSDKTGVLYTFLTPDENNHYHDSNALYTNVFNFCLPNLIEKSKEGKAYYNEVLTQARKLFRPHTAAAQPAAASSQPQAFVDTSQQGQAAQEVLPRLSGDTKLHTPPPTRYEPSKGFGSLKRIHVKQIEGMDAYANSVTTTGDEGLVAPPPVPVIDPMVLREKSGGKSRRRHRRVKFGKSKKGRTTRRIIRKHRR